ncbi:glycosyl hydrolase [Kocuria coralli]|uniref:Glycosyl hydrolase n=1 Tax=Kocuria coralli TaxID=1461025 RepID=A0A5J5KXX0_9MICC|nr:chitinase [Kocuria coralli]KAA9394617.1 glycosyl hydrolase [Kocuria coralli]
MRPLTRLCASVAVLTATALTVSACGQGARPPWFGSYVNATAYPYYEFRDHGPEMGRTVLGFVVADPDSDCSPSWGGYFDLDEAADRLSMDDQVRAVQDSGGDVAISFGGAAGAELATACTDTTELYEAYSSVIDRYGVTTLDFDVEMDDLTDSDAAVRRAEALARLQSEYDDLEIWVTLPASPYGLNEDSQAVVNQILEAEVELAGVNIMTMNYSESKPADQSMAAASEDTARAVHGQLQEIYAQHGQELSEEEVWGRIGLTPMIGQNDVEDEVLDLDGAAELNRFAQEHGVGRMTYWSANRDRACTPENGDPAEANDFCSGVDQETGDFAAALREGFDT